MVRIIKPIDTGFNANTNIIEVNRDSENIINRIYIYKYDGISFFRCQKSVCT